MPLTKVLALIASFDESIQTIFASLSALPHSYHYGSSWPILTNHAKDISKGYDRPSKTRTTHKQGFEGFVEYTVVSVRSSERRIRDRWHKLPVKQVIKNLKTRPSLWNARKFKNVQDSVKVHDESWRLNTGFKISSNLVESSFVQFWHFKDLVFTRKSTSTMLKH